MPTILNLLPVRRPTAGAVDPGIGRRTFGAPAV
jgi:hypothetical protein